MSRIGINITAQAFPSWVNDEVITEVMWALVGNPTHYGIPCHDVWAYREDKLEKHEVNIEGDLSAFSAATTSLVLHAIDRVTEEQRIRRKNYCQFDKNKIKEYAG